MIIEDRVREIIEIPQMLTSYLNSIYTKDDMELIVSMKDRVLSKEEIEVEMGKCIDDILDSAYKTAVVNKILNKEDIKYKVNPITVKINNLATFHRDKWESIPLEDRKKISSWHFHKFLEGKRSITVKEMLENGNRILPLKESIKYIKEVKENIYVIPCDCKSTVENCDFDRNVCISFSNTINTPSDRGYGKKISLEEAIELLEYADKEGLIHSGEKDAICNCCTCCCYPLKASMEMGLEGKWPMVNHIIHMDREKCINCGICVNRCQLNVFEKKEKTVNMDISKCLGCGICVSTCPKGALYLEKLK